MLLDCDGFVLTDRQLPEALIAGRTAPLPFETSVPGVFAAGDVRHGSISSALVVDERVFVDDCGRGSPSAFVEAGLDFTRLEAVLLTHLHADHTGDLVGMLLYPWGVRVSDAGPSRRSVSTGRRDRQRCLRAMPTSIARRRSTRSFRPGHEGPGRATSSPPTPTT